MKQKAGRNDPCPCGSGKKYKSCCWGKEHTKKKLTAKWLNKPSMPNLMERTFGASISKTFGQKPPSASSVETTSEQPPAEKSE
ncbi:MAG: SEC-C domain-containing protein [Parachlamydiaceae bacterium]|nr:MAG: SEC-C domain-containing protein [Parachlamydiaceae bacterium]